MERSYKYNAFISYRHLSPDKEIAAALQKKLENFKPPKSLSKGKKRGNWHIFRDETELPTSSNLGNDIKSALETSEFLIVICSEKTKESRWCMEEIEYFKTLHNGSNANIITLVVSGCPEDVFPPALCNELVPVTDEQGNVTYQSRIIEPLAANVSAPTLRESLKKLNTEILRIAAPMLGCGYDDLYNREQRKKTRRIFTIGGISLAFLSLFTIYTSIMLLRINTQKRELAKSNAVNLGVLSENLWNSGDGVGAIETALSALPSEDNPDQPVVPSVMRILAKEIGAYNLENFTTTTKLTCKDHVAQLGFAGNGSSLVAIDSKSIYFWDSQTGALKKEYPVESFGTFSVTLHFDDTGLYETEALYKANGNAYSRNGFNYMEGYKREKAASISSSISGSDVLVEGDDAVYKLDGTTGDELWHIEYDTFAYASITEAHIIVSESAYNSDYEEVGSKVTIYDRDTGTLLQELILPDPKTDVGLLCKWVSITTDRAYLLDGGISDYQLFSFDISGNTLTNKKLLYSSEQDPLSLEYSFMLNSTPQLIGDDLYLVNTHSDALEYYFVTNILVFDKNGHQTQSHTYETAYDSGKHVRVALFDKDLYHNFCDVLVVAQGNRLALCNNETGDLLATYTLDSPIKTSYVSQNGFLTVITANGYEVAYSLRKATSTERLKTPLMYQTHNFLSPHAMYARSGHSYAVVNKNASDIYLYADVENLDFHTYYANKDNSTISEVHINTSQTYAAIDSYDQVDICNLQTGETYQLASDDEYFDHMQFISDDRFAICANDQIDVYDVRTQERVATYTGDFNSFLANGNYAEFLSVDGTLIFREDNKITLVAPDGQRTNWEPLSDRNSKYPGSLSEVYPSDTGKILFYLNYFSDEKRVVELLDVNTGETVLLDIEFSGTLSDDTLSLHRVMWPNNNQVSLALSDGSIRYFDLTTGACTHSFQPETPTIVSLVPLDSDNVLGILANDSVLYKVKVSDGTILDQVDLANDRIRSASGNDLTKSSLIPKHNVLVLAGWAFPSHYAGGYVIDLDTFDVIYDIKGYEDYYVAEDTFLVTDYSIFGSYPFYSAAHLAAKARQSIATN